MFTAWVASVRRPSCLQPAQPAQPASEADRGEAPARLCNAVLSSYAATDPKQTPSRLFARMQPSRQELQSIMVTEA